MNSNDFNTEFSRWFSEPLERITESGLRRERRVVTPLPDGRCLVDGKRLLNFSGNDYLNLATDPRLIAAAKNALDEHGCGATASALVSGRGPWHQRLEERIAQFEGTEAALLFPSGYAANVGVLTALLAKEDVVYCDRLNHASLIDGCRLSGVTLRIFRHDQLEKLERALKKNNVENGSQKRCWIVTDTVFSMDGSVAPLMELCDIAERFGAAIIVDEAHGTAVFGEQGRGVAEWQQVEQRVAIRIGTLSKAVGCLGGFVVGKRTVIDLLWNTARPQIFSTALPPSICAAAVTAFDIITNEPQRRQQLHLIADKLRQRLRENGVTISEQCVAPIIPIIVGDPEKTVAQSKQLEANGFLVPAIRPPTVPQGTSRWRISLNCAHSTNDIEQLTKAIIPLTKK